MQWRVAEKILEEIKKQFPEIDPAVLQLLFNRNIKTQEEIDVYLSPDWSRDTFSPHLFNNMSEAIKRVFDSLEAGDVITVHGDYDADGVCASAILISTLKEICREFDFDKLKITSYIPHREKEGYGMSVETIEHLHEHDKTKLVIAVDCGISNKPAVDRGKEQGMDTIICDHHTMPEELPDQAILIHPLVPGEKFPNKHLCGTSVAFKLASALLDEARTRGASFPAGYEKWLLDLVAIATVTDVMPLTGENRVLEKYGLLVLNKTRRKGIQKLIDIAGSKKGKLDTVSIGFQLGPRINAAGRMTHANEALALMVEEDDLQATKFAMQLNDRNKERQAASQQMYLQAKKLVKDPGDQKLLIVCQQGWPAGLVGLVAGKLVNEFHVPTFVVGQDGEKFVGSGRSIKGFDITKAMHAASEHLDRFGGHPEACGFSTTGQDRFEKAKSVMLEYAQTQIKDEMLLPILNIDAEIDFKDVTWDLQKELEKFEPFGKGNPQPIFASKQVEVVDKRYVGADGKHLRLTVRSPRGTIMKMIGFRFGEMFDQLEIGKPIDVAYEIGVNEWNGNRELQLKIVDIKLR